MIRDLGFFFGSFGTAGIGVFQMQNWNILTLSFWATLTGILFYSLIAGALGAAFFDKIKKQITQWLGIGVIHSKGL